MTTNPVDLLFNAYRRRVLALLLLRPEESLYVRELSRLTGVPAGSLHRELQVLTRAGLVLREPTGNQVRYRANRACPIYPELAGIFRKTAGLVDLLRDALAPLGKRVEVAFVFGSMAQGTETASSDVDLFVVGRATLAEVVALVAPLHPRLGREVNAVAMTRKEFDAQRASGDRFVRRVIAEPRLFVVGDDDDVG